MQRECRYWKFPHQRPGVYIQRCQIQNHFTNLTNTPVGAKFWITIRDKVLRMARRQRQHQRGDSAESMDEITCQHCPAVGTNAHRGGAGQHDHKVVDGDWREAVFFRAGEQPEVFGAHNIKSDTNSHPGCDHACRPRRWRSYLSRSKHSGSTPLWNH
jgi:hypothetical protein